MKIRVKYFAHYREKTGKKEEYLEGDFKAVHELLEHLEKKYGVDTESSMVAVNRKVVSREESLSPADEVAVFPPVSGG